MAETLFHCCDALWARFAALCRARDETPGAVLCNLVRLDLARRFGTGFPGHPRPGLAAQALARGRENGPVRPA